MHGMSQNKGTLIGRDQFIQQRSHSVHQNFGYCFVDHRTKANGSIMTGLQWLSIFGISVMKLWLISLKIFQFQKKFYQLTKSGPSIFQYCFKEPIPNPSGSGVLMESILNQACLIPCISGNHINCKLSTSVIIFDKPK